MYVVGLMTFVLFLSTLVGIPVLPQLSRELGAEGAFFLYEVTAVIESVFVIAVIPAFIAFFAFLIWLPKEKVQKQELNSSSC